MRYSEILLEFTIPVIPLHQGMYGIVTRDQVKSMQSSLQQLGYDLGPAGIDGKYGPYTAAAVESFKRDYNLPGDGKSFRYDAIKTLYNLKKGSVDKVSTVSQTSPSKYQTTKPVTSKYRLPPLKSSSATSGKIGQVLDFIAKYESSGSYDSVYPGKRKPEILSMTLRELLQDMRYRGRLTGSSASGRYQYIRSTLMQMIREMGLDVDNTVFDQKTQDSIVIHHLRRYHRLDDWLSGRISTESFLNRLSRTWAGLPNPKTGVSYYQNVMSNRAGVDVATAVDILDNIRNT